MMKAVIELATEAGIAAYQKAAEEERKKRKDRYLHNTEVMLKNYRDWVMHSSNGSYDAPAPTPEEERRDCLLYTSG